MMPNLKLLIDLVRDFQIKGAHTDERERTLTMRGCFTDSDTQAAWLAFTEKPPVPFEAVQIYDVEVGGDVTSDQGFDPEREISITIVKPKIQRVACFFFQDSLAGYFMGTIEAVTLYVADLPLECTFQARGLEIKPWTHDQELVAPPSPEVINPLKFVADFVPTREVPQDLSPWLLLSSPAQISQAFESWRMISARKIMSGLVSNALADNTVVWLQISGPPIFRIRADDPLLIDSWEMLTRIAHWVFLSGLDVEARHILFSGELTRADRPGQIFSTTLERAFDAAQVAYEAHVQSSSRETLKALAELRKVVIDETQKVAQRTQEMTSGVVRTLIILAVPLTLKISSNVDNSTPNIINVICIASAIFILTLFFLQCRINEAYFLSQENSRNSWMQTLRPYISDKEREEIADLPIKQALKSYEETCIFLFLVNNWIAAGLVMLACCV